MRRLTKIILGGGLFLVLAGGLLALTGWVLGAQTSLDLDWSGRGLRIIPGFIQEESGATGTRQTRADLKLAPFDTLDIDVALGEINVLAGDTYGVELNWRGERYELSYENENGTLRVWSTTKPGISLSPINWGYDATATIYVPAQALLENAHISADLGSVYLEDLTLEHMTIDASMGDVTMEQLTAHALELELDMGSLNGDGLTVADTLTAKCSMGDMYLGGDLAGEIELNCSMGDITLSTSRPADSFGYDLDISMGEITVDGEEYSKKARHDGAPNFLTAESDMGDITVDFG